MANTGDAADRIARVAQREGVSGYNVDSISLDSGTEVDWQSDDEVDFLTYGDAEKSPILFGKEGGDVFSSKFSFDGKKLEIISGERVLVRDAASGEPEALILAPWARTESGVDVPTYFTTQGNTLVQTVEATGFDGDYIVADPQIRDVRHNGKKVGQDLVISPKDWAVMSAGMAACRAYISKLPHPAAKAAGVFCRAALDAAAVAGPAFTDGKCLAIRALGPADGINVVFPYRVDC